MLLTKQDSSHYSKALNPLEMLQWSFTVAEYVADRCEESNTLPLLVFSGFSGISHGIALSLALSRNPRIQGMGQLYVRKAEEKSHSSEIVEYSFSESDLLDNKQYTLVFVDDFISSGKTLVYCLTQALEFVNSFSKSINLSDTLLIATFQPGNYDDALGWKLLRENNVLEVLDTPIRVVVEE